MSEDAAPARGPLADWAARFLWSPARDLHPSRRAALAPGWDAAAWDSPRVLRHVSRHLLAAAPPPPPLEFAEPAVRLALLPQPPLGALARRLGLVLRPAAEREALDEAERAFLATRARLYWRGPRPDGDAPFDALGWGALRAALAPLPAALRLRFDWKLPLDAAAEVAADPAALQAAALRILKEFETPWSSSFVNPPA